MRIRPGYKLTEAGEIPDNWEVTSLRDFISTIETGSRPKGGAFNVNEGVPSIGGEHITKQGRLDLSSLKYVPSDFFQSMKRGQLEDKDVLIVKDGATVGKVTFLEKLPYEEMAVNEHVFILRAKEKPDQEFLFYCLSWDRIQNMIKSIRTGSAQPGINQEFTEHITIPIPLSNERRKIASILSTVDATIQKTDEITAKTRQLEKGLMQHLLTKGIGHTKFKQTEVGKIPEEWNVTTIGSITQVRNGTTPRRSVREYWENGTIPWIPTAQVNDRYIAKAHEHITDKGLRETSLSWVPNGSILLAMIGQGTTRGKVAKLLIDATINQNFAAIFPSPDIDMDFLFHYLDFNYPRIRNLGRGGNQWALNCEVVKKIRIPIPEKNEQITIASILSCVDGKIEKEKERKGQLAQLKNGLMQVLLTGKVRVKVN